MKYICRAYVLYSKCALTSRVVARRYRDLPASRSVVIVDERNTRSWSYVPGIPPPPLPSFVARCFGAFDPNAGNTKEDERLRGGWKGGKETRGGEEEAVEPSGEKKHGK